MIKRELMLEAEKGDKKCMRELGKFYLEQNCCNFAFYWICRAAKKGDKDAMFLLGEFYRSGIGTRIDEKKALKWLKKASRAHVFGATVQLMSDYICGVYRGKQKKVFGMCKQVTRQNLRLGEYFLGVCYYDGIGVKRDIEKARYHLTISAINGFAQSRKLLGDAAFSVSVGDVV